MTDLKIVPESEEWYRLRHRCQTDLYFLNAKVLRLEHLLPMRPLAHYGMCRFAERRTGIPEIDHCRVQLLQITRGWGKSALITGGRSVQRLLVDPNWSTGIANEKAGNAESFLGRVKSQFETNDFLRALFPEIIPDFRKTTWRSDRIIVNRTKQDPVNPSILAAGVDTAAASVHMDEWIMDDLISRDAAENARTGTFTQIDQVNRWIDQLPYLLRDFQTGPLLFIGCVAHDELILMADGSWKKIQNVQVGDMVWACKKDGSEGFKAREVMGVWPQGYSPVVEVNTAGRKLICTYDHPLLASRGRTDGIGRKWKRAEDFGRFASGAGHRIEVFSGMPGSETECDYNFAWLAGFMWGDGWVTKYTRPDGEMNYAVCFALGESEALNRRVVRLLDKHFGGIGGKCYHSKKCCVRMDNNEAGRRWEGWGLKAGIRAPDKILPEWLFTSSWKCKRAFLHGLCSADGHRTRPRRWAFSTASKTMAEQVRLLAMSCNIRPTLVFDSSKIKQAPNSPEPKWSRSFTVSLNFGRDYEVLHAYGVKSVIPLAVQMPVYDLTVEDGDCAFVASGYLTQNTPWWPGDCYDYIREKFGHGEESQRFLWLLELPDGTRQEIVLEKRGELAIFRLIPYAEGKALYPEHLSMEAMESLRRSDPVTYASQILLEPTSGEVVLFKPGYLKEFHWEVPSRQIRFRDAENVLHYERVDSLRKVMSVDPAISSKSGAARSGITITGSNGDYLFLLETWAKRVGPTELATKIIELYQTYHPMRILIEDVAYQLALASILRVLQDKYKIGQLPLFGYKTGTDTQKDQRICGLEPYFKKGLFYWNPTSQQDFYKEYISFSPHIRSPKRDLLDSLSFQIESWEHLRFLGTDVDTPRPFSQDWKRRVDERMSKIRSYYSVRRRKTKDLSEDKRWTST